MVTRVPLSMVGEPINVVAKGADSTGVADSTAAIQAAIDSLGGAAGVIFFPAGVYRVLGTISITNDRQWLVGQGRWSSVIRFEPSGTDICIFVGKGGEGTTDGGVLYEFACKGLTFRSTDTTTKKTAIELKDCAFSAIEDVHIGGSTRWIGASSIGLRTRGRDSLLVRNCVIECSLPIVLGYNDNFPSICADHFRFENLVLATRAHLESPANYATAVITCEPGINLSNVSFGGYQAWLRGRHGFHYDNSSTAAAGASYGVVFENIRWEGEPGDDDTGYCFYLDHGATSTINNVRIVNMQAGEIGNGIYLRNFLNADLESCNWQIGARVALNIDSSSGSEVVRVSNCSWTSGCTASIGAAFKVYAALPAINTSPIVRTGEYTAATTRRDFITGGATYEWTAAIAATDPTVESLPFRSLSSVIFTYTDTRGKTAIVAIDAVGKTAALVYGDSAVFSITKDTASKINFYWESGDSTWKVQNKTGVSRTAWVQSLGSHVGA